MCLQAVAGECSLGSPSLPCGMFWLSPAHPQDRAGWVAPVLLVGPRSLELCCNGPALVQTPSPHCHSCRHQDPHCPSPDGAATSALLRLCGLHSCLAAAAYALFSSIWPLWLAAGSIQGALLEAGTLRPGPDGVRAPRWWSRWCLFGES